MRDETYWRDKSLRRISLMKDSPKMDGCFRVHCIVKLNIVQWVETSEYFVEGNTKKVLRKRLQLTTP